MGETPPRREDMAYPEAIPPLTPQEGKDFLKRLRAFKLTKEQQKFWSDPAATEVKPRKQ